MSNPCPLSVYLITFNEAERLDEVLSAVSFAAEIIVVDSGSTDDTIMIAERHGARVIHRNWPGFAKQKAFAMSQCTQPWLLNLDGDEVLSEESAAHIQTVVTGESPSHGAYRLHFEDIFWGRPMSSKAAKRHIVRLFRQGTARYPEDRMVHENVKLEKGTTTGDIKGLVMHYGYGSTELLMNKQNSYSSLKAQQKFNSNKKPSLLKLLLVFPLTFLKTYLFKRHFMSGKRGLTHAYIESMYAFLKEAKLFELTERNK